MVEQLNCPVWLEPSYGWAECIREGFQQMTPREFIDMFCASHKGCRRDSIVTRIEFEYLPKQHEGNHGVPAHCGAGGNADAQQVGAPSPDSGEKPCS